MQYLLLIHGNSKTPPSSQDWSAFFERAKESGTFRGGSAIGAKQVIGTSASPIFSEHITGFMRFDCDDKQRVLDLLSHHPIVANGGTVELCEMPVA